MNNRTKVVLCASRTLFLLSALTLALSAQTPQHSVALTWQDALNPAGTTYSVYRSAGLCSGSPVFAKMAAAITNKAYEDTTVSPGNYCYQVTASVNGMESAPSAAIAAAVPSFSPTNGAATVK